VESRPFLRGSVFAEAGRSFIHPAAPPGFNERCNVSKHKPQTTVFLASASVPVEQTPQRPKRKVISLAESQWADTPQMTAEEAFSRLQFCDLRDTGCHVSKRP
jgi:hypothetical protein